MRFLLQPFGTPAETHFPAIRSLLDAPELDHFLFLSAFVRRSGVEQIEEALKNRRDQVTVIAGVNNGVTSLQGLRSLLDAGAKVFTFDTGTPFRIFHPKVFLGWGPCKSQLVIGSANLTLPGLANNIEASLEVELDLTVAAERTTFEAARDSFASASKLFPEYCKVASSTAALQVLFDVGRLEDEDAVPETPEVPASKASNSAKASSLKPIPLPWIQGKSGKKAGAKPLPPSTAVPGPTGPGDVSSPATSRGPLVWQKPNLKGTDAQQPPSPGTNPTGNLRLASARFMVGGKIINKLSYFRKSVFGSLFWSKSGTTEYATAGFHLLKSGKPLGTFDLKVSHDLKRVANQNNVPTVLHWGDAVSAIRSAKVKGLTLRLYGAGADGRFAIEFA